MLLGLGTGCISKIFMLGIMTDKVIDEMFESVLLIFDFVSELYKDPVYELY